MYERRLFGAEAQQYIRSQADWADPISKNLLTLPLEQGTVWAFLPRGFQMNAPDDFSYGRAWDPADPQGGSALTLGFTLQYLQANPARLALFASAWHENEPAAQNLRTPYVLIGEPSESKGRLICHYVAAQDASVDNIENAMREARAWPFVGALTSLPEGWLSLQPSQRLSDREAQQLAQRTEHLLAEAFDDSAKLIWSRRFDSQREA